MVHPDSNRISRVPSYSGNPLKTANLFDYRAITFYGRNFHTVLLRFNCLFVEAPTTPSLKETWFGLIRVRSPLLTESQLISFPAGT